MSGDKAAVAKVLQWRKVNAQRYRNYQREYMRKKRQEAASGGTNDHAGEVRGTDGDGGQLPALPPMVR